MQITTLEKAGNKINKMAENYHDEFIDTGDIVFDGIGSVQIAGQPHHMRKSGQQLMANRLGIPMQYLSKCPEDLQADNLNYFMSQERNDKLFFRFDGSEVRAVFTPRYVPADNVAVFERLMDMGYESDTQVQFSVDNSFMSVSILSGRRSFDINGDKFTPGVSVVNSETGRSSLSIAAFMLRLICENGLINKTEISAAYKHTSVKILNDFPAVLDRVGSELGRQRDKFRISADTHVDNPLSTLATIGTQFNLGKAEKEAVEWAWPYESGETMFQVINTFTKASQREGLGAESQHKLQKTGGAVLEMLK